MPKLLANRWFRWTLLVIAFPERLQDMNADGRIGGKVFEWVGRHAGESFAKRRTSLSERPTSSAMAWCVMPFRRQL